MSSIAIVTDSTVSLPSELVQKYQITVTPQVVIWGEQILQDGIDITPEAFYTRLSTTKVMPTTSQASPNTFSKILSALEVNGTEEVLCILVSSKLSGTIGSLHQAIPQFPLLKIHLIDSLSVSMGLGFQVLAAARALNAGGSLEDAIAVANTARQQSGLLLTPETMEFLHRGGRIGGGARFLATALNIKPILEVIDGRVEAVERVRTRKKALKHIVDTIAERVAGKNYVRLAVLHANAPDEANNLLELAISSMPIPVEEVITTEVSPAVGCHAGPGTVGMAYVTDV